MNSASPRSLFAKSSVTNFNFPSPDKRLSKFCKEEVKKIDKDEDFSDNDSTRSSVGPGQFNRDYNTLFNEDFDQRKIFEDAVLKILNEHSREALSHPEGAENFKSKFAKPESLGHLKRTVFLDLDDTLVMISF